MRSLPAPISLSLALELPAGTFAPLSHTQSLTPHVQQNRSNQKLTPLKIPSAQFSVSRMRYLRPPKRCVCVYMCARALKEGSVFVMPGVTPHFLTVFVMPGVTPLVLHSIHVLTHSLPMLSCTPTPEPCPRLLPLLLPLKWRTTTTVFFLAC